MTVSVQRIANQVKALPKKEFDEFLSWLAEYELEHADEWDAELERDSQPGGGLDSVLRRVRSDIAGGQRSEGTPMTGLEALQSVQYVKVGGKRLAVVSADDWEALIEWLETVEDVQIAREAAAQLGASGGDRGRAGYLRWDDAKEELA